jgi:hypothetical protein
MTPEREWWLRVPAVLLGPRSVFVALRDDSQEGVDARQEPVLALVYLAGVAAVLGTSTAGRLFEDPAYDGLLAAVWAIVAGGFYAFAGYWLIGGALYLGARGLGGLGDYRRSRHVLAYALAPLALSLFLLWPLQLAAFGTDVFERGGSDEGAAGTLFDGLELGFALWSAALVLVGVRAVHGWSWWRSLGALGLVALFLAAFAYLPSVL